MVRAALGLSCPRVPVAGIQVADALQQGIGKAACLQAALFPCAVLALLLRCSLAGATQPQRRTAADFSAQPNPSGSLLHRPMLRRHARCWPRQRGGVQCWTRLMPQQRRSVFQQHERLCMRLVLPTQLPWCGTWFQIGCIDVPAAAPPHSKPFVIPMQEALALASEKRQLKGALDDAQKQIAVLRGQLDAARALAPQVCCRAQASRHDARAAKWQGCAKGSPCAASM